MIKRLKKWWSEFGVTTIETAPGTMPLIPPRPPAYWATGSVLHSAQTQERLKVTGKCCQACGASFSLQYPAVKYTNDEQHGERLLITCWLCNFKWAKPVINESR